MRLFHLPPREIAIDANEGQVLFPAQINLNIELDPPELFGEAEFTDSLRVFPTDGGTRDLFWSADFFSGSRRMASKDPARFEQFSCQSEFFGVPVAFKGNIATLNFICPEPDHFYFFIQKVIEEFSSAFACTTIAPVSITKISGSANGFPFHVRVKSEFMTDAPFSIGDNFHKIMADRLGQVLPYCGTLPVQVVAGMRYLSQSLLLESVSRYSYQFTSERMLNVCKALESLMSEAGDSVDKMKTILRSWDVHEKYIDMFASIRYLRNELDVGHKAYSRLSESAYKKIQEFLPLAENCIQLLVITAVDQVKNKKYTYSEHIQSEDEPNAIKKLANYKELSIKQTGDLTTIENVHID